MRLLIKLCLFLSFLSGPQLIHAEQMKLELIPLQYRNVDEIIPILRPLVVPGGSVTGMNDQLIIKTTPGNLQELRQVLAGIDKAARRLMITVKQNIDGNIHTREHGVSGQYRNDDVFVSNRDGNRNRNGLSVGIADKEGNNLKYRNLSTRSSLDDKNTFQVQTLDGKAAFIQTGQQVPIANRNAYVTHGGNFVVQDTIDYHDVSSGFYVLPRVSGDRVTLQVSPQLSRVQPNQGAVFEVQNAETTTVGRLGEWIEIGGVDQHFDSENREILSSSRQKGYEKRNILIRVDEIH